MPTMNTPPNGLPAMHSMRAGVFFAFLSILFGFGMGGTFGAFEESLKAGLKSDADAVLDSVYKNDQVKLKANLDKAWTYYKRAHLHGGAMGTTALAAILAMAACGAGPRGLRSLAALGLGLGSLGYALFWLLAGMRAPGLGSTGAAKESLEWLAIPCAGMALLGLILALVLVMRSLFARSSS